MADIDSFYQWKMDVTPMDVAFGAGDRLVAAGLVDGTLCARKIRRKERLSEKGKSFQLEAVEAFTIGRAHEDSCRSLTFLDETETIASGSADGAIKLTDACIGKENRMLKKAHESGVGRIIGVDANTFVSGDEEGLVKLWDAREKGSIRTLDGHTDFISDLLWVEGANRLLSTGGDGTMGVYDLKKGKEIARSENQEDELLSVLVMKQGNKVICGTQSGMINIFTWGYFKDMNDRLAGHPESVDAMIKFDEDTILTGSSDGIIRIVQVLPNQIIGVVGEHMNYPIERLAMSMDRMSLASTSHDNSIKLWDLSYLHEESADDVENQEQAVHTQTALDKESTSTDSEDEGGKRRTKRKDKGGGKKKKKCSTTSSFFDDL